VPNPLTAALLLVLAGTAPPAQDSAVSSPASCRGPVDCRERALEAAERKDYEAFHDLAWRAVQLGPKNDPVLLFLLARAQSLSGRPHDALVMLRRLASTGAANAALTSAEFERVRALKEWPEVMSLFSGADPPAAATATPPTRPEVGAPAAPAPPATTTRAITALPEPITFAAASFKPAALAYDAVSRRFIISDTDVSRLAVVDEFSRQLATLASGRAGGFGIITAIEIDPREGNLWVASVDGISGTEVPSLHKLQLISGRVLKKFSAPQGLAGRLVDIAVGGDGAVFAVQADGLILRLAPGGVSLAPSTRITHTTFSSVTTSSEGAVYVARPDGLLRYRPSPSVLVQAPPAADLSRLARIRWSRGALVGLQDAGNGTYRVVRIRLSRDGRSATAVEVLDEAVRTPNPSAATLVGDVFYYLTETGGSELAIRRVNIK
jgi:hypothetical protein